MKKNILLCSLTLSCVVLAANSFAAAVPDIFICAAAEAVACGKDETCVKGSAARVSLPPIWKVKLAEKAILSIMETGEERTSPINDTIETENRLVLFGVDGKTAWTIQINIDDGLMTLVSSTEDTGFIVHGTCSSKILK